MTNRPRPSALGLVVFVAGALLAAPAFSQQLPQTAPLPPERPGGVAPSNPAAPDLPANAPVPETPPVAAAPDARLKDDAAEKTPPAATPQAELVCRKALRDLGTVFRDTQPPASENGCSMPFPVEVSAFGAQTDVTTDVTLNCAMALATGDFIRDVIQPAAKDVFGASVKSIAQASGYVCRPRNGTTKLSEHAFGNALDIASFTLSTGEVVDVKPSPPGKHAMFLKRVRDAACGPFKTVLGPGSNADHEFHFHLDLAQRRNGGTYCR